MKEQFLRFVRDNPSATQADAAREFGVSRQRISQLCAALDIKMANGHAKRRATRPPPKPKVTHFGAPIKEGGAANCSMIGAAGEMTVAADLLRKGFPVYRAMASVGNFDLAAVIDSKLVRVECRCAKYQGNRLVCAIPDKARYDILAMVAPDGEVRYTPELETFMGIDHP